MIKSKRPLPIGLQTFLTMIEEDYLYIDKTSYIYNLISTGRYYFLSRPRRFGKSLLMSTLAELLGGNRALFKSLFIDSTDYDWQKYPVIVLSFAEMSAKSPEILEKEISWSLSNIGERYGIDLSKAPSITTQFKLLIQELGKQGKVAVLVDEHDYPIVSNIDDHEVAEKCRKVLRDFFSVLKGIEVDKHLQFVFITGVSKFSKTSIFSGLNNLQDISLDSRAAPLLGYSIGEIKTAYHEYLEEISIARKKTIDEIVAELKFWYDGYYFADPKKVPDAQMFNPFSVMLYLLNAEFLNYWFETGTPTFLMRLMRQKNFPMLSAEDMQVSADNAIEDVSKINLKSILWQTGYLTIESYDQKTKNYTLRFPNEEVKVSFYQSLLKELTEKEIADVSSIAYALRHSLNKADLKEFFELLQSFLAQLPYLVQLPQEKYYQSIFYVLMSLIGAKIVVEEATNSGRIDAVIENDGHIFVLEFKLYDDAKTALEQIEQKNYHQKYLKKDKMVHLVGVKFDVSKRNITQWLSKAISPKKETALTD